MNKHRMAQRLRAVIYQYGVAGTVVVGLFLVGCYSVAALRKRRAFLVGAFLVVFTLFTIRTQNTGSKKTAAPFVASYSDGNELTIPAPKYVPSSPESPELRRLIAALGTANGRAASIRLVFYGKAAVPALVRASRSQSWRMRYWAVAAMSMIGGENVRETIEQGFVDPDPRVRISAVVASTQSSTDSDKHEFAYFNRLNIETDVAAHTVVSAILDRSQLREAKRIVERLDGSPTRALSLPNSTCTRHVVLRSGKTRLVLTLVEEHDWDSQDTDDRNCRIHVYSFDGVAIREQDLPVPVGCCGSGASLIKFHGDQVLMIKYWDPNTGTDGVTMPVFYRRSGDRWVMAQSDSRLLKCSQFGRSWFDTSGRYRICDYIPVYDTKRFPARFRLRMFQWTGTRMTLLRTEFTRRAYEGLTCCCEPGKSLAAIDDPLHEFGMKWQ